MSLILIAAITTGVSRRQAEELLEGVDAIMFSIRYTSSQIQSSKLDLGTVKLIKQGDHYTQAALMPWHSMEANQNLSLYMPSGYKVRTLGTTNHKQLTRI